MKFRWTKNPRIDAVIADNDVVNGATWFVLFHLWAKGDQDFAADNGLIFG